jgi:hypothetical protein
MRVPIATVALVIGLPPPAPCLVDPDPISGSGGAGGVATCDGKGNCDQCLACTRQAGCLSVISACNDQSACVAIDQCIALCGANTSCRQECFANNPAGLNLYSAMRTCMFCDECPSDCAGFETCE